MDSETLARKLREAADAVEEGDHSSTIFYFAGNEYFTSPYDASLAAAEEVSSCLEMGVEVDDDFGWGICVTIETGAEIAVGWEEDDD